MEKKKTLGGNIILAGSIFLNIYGVYFIYNAIKLFTSGQEALASHGGAYIQGANIFVSLLIFIIASFSIRHKENVDAGKAIFNRGIFIIIVSLGIFLVHQLMVGFNHHYLMLVLNGVLLTAGGFLNNLQCKRELGL